MSRSWISPLLGLSFALGAATNACGDAADDAADAGDWLCAKGADDCQCVLVPPSATGSASNPVSGCFRYSCCVRSHERGGALGECNCTEEPASECAALAANRGWTVVSECPPGGVEACARAGQNCRPEFLREHGLDGCCSGMMCRSDADGNPSCQVASDTELVLSAACSKLASDETRDSALVIASGPVHTSRGDLAFDTAMASSLGVGPGGCLNRITLELGQAACTLRFEVALEGAALATTNISASSSCFPPLTLPSVPTQGVPELAEFSFDGLACNDFNFGEVYCVTGTFDWHLAGTIADVSFPDQHVTLQGTVCRSVPMGACPI